MATNYLVISREDGSDGGIYMDFVRAESQARAEEILGRLRSGHIEETSIFSYTPSQLRELADELQFETPEQIREDLNEVADIRFHGFVSEMGRCLECDRFLARGKYAVCTNCTGGRKGTAGESTALTNVV